MQRTSAALLLLVVLFAAACGSGGSNQPPMPGTVTSATSLTPTAYRTQVNALCTKAKHELGTVSTSSLNSTAAATALLQKALGIFQPIQSTMQGLKPPASLAAGHRKLVASLTTLVDGGQALIAKLKSGAPIAATLNSPQVKSLSTAVTGMKTGFKTLGLTTCTNLIGGK